MKLELAKQCNYSVKQVYDWLYREKKKKINENRLTIEQKNILLEHFNYNNMRPSLQEKEKLKKLTHSSNKKISEWFCSQRFKIKNNIL